MSSNRQIARKISELLKSQNVAVLATYGDGQPYTSLVAFRAGMDLKGIFFVTTRASHKYRNIKSCGNAALLVDNRSNSASDFQEAIAVTAVGEVEELDEKETEKNLGCYLDKHPHLSAFASSPTTCMLRLRIKEYYLVSKFQQVERLSMA